MWYGFFLVRFLHIVVDQHRKVSDPCKIPKKVSLPLSETMAYALTGSWVLDCRLSLCEWRGRMV